MKSPIIEFSDVALRFGQTEVHRDISFKVCSGETLTVLGPSGTGKTMILKMIIGLIRPTSGSVRVFDRNVCEMNEDELRAVRAQAGMLFQGAALFDSLSVYDNVAYGLREAGRAQGTPLAEDRIREIVEDKLRMVGLPGIGAKLPSQLSGGQRKRVGLARALASSPRILLLDEPTTGLDPTSIRMIDELIVSLSESLRLTCIAVTHDIESARRISQRWILVAGGRVVADGPAGELGERNEDVGRFVRGQWGEG